MLNPLKIVILKNLGPNKGKMSVRTGITRLYNFTVSDAVIALTATVKAIMYFRNWWRSADPFKQYRVVQLPVEILGLAPIFSVATVVSILYSAGNIPIPMFVFGPLVGIPVVFFSMIGKDRILKRLREILIMPDPIIAFDCVHCNLRHGAIGHSKHPPKKCKTCKTPWKDEWADYL